MWFRKAIRALLPAAALGLVLWACHLTGDEQAFFDVRADSTWTAFDEVKVVLAAQDGTPIDTLFKGKLNSPAQLSKLPAPGYDGRLVQIILIGFKNGKPAKIETRNYDGSTQTEVGPVLVTLPGDKKDSALDLKPDTLRIYVGGPAVSLSPGSAWTEKTLVWSSSNTKVASVNGGFVASIGPGVCFISAESGSAKDSSRVTVVLDPPILDAGGDTALPIDANASFAVKVRQEFGGVSAFKWSLDGDSVWDDSASGMPSQANTLFTPPRAFSRAGTFTLRFLVRDGEGNETIATRTLSVANQIPKITSFPRDTAITVGDSLSITAKAEVNSGSLGKYAWSFGDGSSPVTGTLSGGAAAIAGGHRFGKDGTFKVSLTVENDAGIPISSSFAITVSPKGQPIPPVAHAGNDTSVQVMTKASLHGTARDPDGTVTKLEWSIGGGAFTATSGDTSIIPSTVGPVRCILRATDNDGMTALDTVIITATQSSPPVISPFSPSDTDVSINDSIPFSATVTGSGPLDSYSWDFNGDGAPDQIGSLSGTAAIVKTGKRFPAAGNFMITFKVTDKAGNVQTKQSAILVETDPPKADAGKDTTVEAGARAFLHGKASDRLGKVVKTEWKIGSGNYAEAPPETSLVVSLVGPVAVPCTFRVTDDDGLRDSAVVTVNVKPSTDASLKELILSSGTLSPAFSPTVTSYSVSLAEYLNIIAMEAHPNSPGTTVTINGVESQQQSISLHVGANPITIVVTAQDNATRKTYTLTVTRLDQTPPGMPVMTNPAISTSATPTWTWTSGGDGSGTFRYKLDDTSITTGATTTVPSFKPASALADGYHTLYVQERDSAGNWSPAANMKLAVTVGPISWYKFDGDYKDAGLNANDGTVSGTVAFVPDRSGAANKAVSFASENGSITTGTGAGFKTGSSFTATAWFSLVAGSVSERNVVVSTGFRFLADGDSVYFGLDNPDGSFHYASCKVTPAQWTQITGTYDGKAIKIYKDGTVQSTQSYSSTVSGTLDGMIVGTLGTFFYDGKLDDFRIYNRVLTQSEITAIANGSM